MSLDLLLSTLEKRDRLTEEEKAVVLALPVTEAHFNPGQDMIQEESRPLNSTLIADGFAARFQSLEDGDRQICAFHIPGDFIDLHSFTLKEMDHGVVAISKTRVLQVPHEALRRVTEAYPHVSRLLWLLTTIDAAIHRKWIASLGKRQGADRLAHLICELFSRFEVIEPATGNAFEFPVTQSILADALGFSIVHTNRMVKQLRQENLVTWEGAKVTILNWPALVRKAEFNARYLNLRQEAR